MTNKRNLPALFAPLMFGAAGILMAAIIQALYNHGVFVTAFATMGVTVAEVMILVIGIWILIGIIAAVIWS